ncbi:LysM peptidoglycan-binding domain-containing protein [Nocardioides montaniterrae]
MSTISFSPTYDYRPQLRLTRRGRLVVLALALIAIFAIGLAVASASAGGAHAGDADVHVVTVHPGDTLWDIAGTAAGSVGVTTGEMVQRITDLNDVTDGMVYAGQDLRVPNN